MPNGSARKPSPSAKRSSHHRSRSEAELQATLEFYRLMGQLAPIAIAEEWNDLVVNLETAAALVPGDPESEQLVAMTAYRHRTLRLPGQEVAGCQLRARDSDHDDRSPGTRAGTHDDDRPGTHERIERLTVRGADRE